MKYKKEIDITQDMLAPRDHIIQSGYESDILEALTMSLTGSISVLDEDLNYRFISAATYGNFGFSPEDLKVGDNLSDCHELMVRKGLITDKILESARLSETQTQGAGNGEVFTQTMRLKDGALKRITRRKLTNGLTVSLTCDISDLHEKTQILEETLELGKSAYWIYDIPSKKYELSETMWRFVGENRMESFNAHGILALVYPEDRDIFKSGLANSIKTNGFFTFEARHRLNENDKQKNREKGIDADYIWARTTCAVIRDDDGKPLKIRAFVQNITRHKAQEAALEHAKDEAISASKAKSEFLANMSHEIRTPMNGILGMAELLANTEIDERQHEFIKVINNSASALLTIINDILDFSKIEAGAFELDPTSFDLKEAVNDVASLLSAKAQDQGLELIVNYGTNLSRNFIGDAGRIRQILTNLVGNAIKFTDTGYVVIDVDIKASSQEGHSDLSLKVTDTGIGIEPEKVDSIFQKFTQADGSTTRIYGGTGLGLSISKHITEMMGGNMTAQSVFGKGSSFTCNIPLKIDVNAKQTRYDTSSILGKRALIVDDIAVNRSLLSEHLQAWNMRATSVKDGVDAIIELKKAAEDDNDPYDIILLDYLMPGMNGQELANVIYSNQNLPRTPIIMLSSCDQPVSSEELAKIDIVTYLLKPVREQRLFDSLIRAMSEFQDVERTKTPSKPVTSNTKGPNVVTRETRVCKDLFDETNETSTAAQNGFEILVAEDFALNQDVVRLMLADTVFNPVFANNGQEAVNLFTENPDRFGLILMDISMPIMDGYEACAHIIEHQENNGLPHIPIIALTGHALKHDRERCLEAGMNAYLTKPVKQIELIESLEHWTTQTNAIVKSA